MAGSLPRENPLPPGLRGGIAATLASFLHCLFPAPDFRCSSHPQGTQDVLGTQP